MSSPAPHGLRHDVSLACAPRFETLGFLLANKVPRRWLTLLMGWFSTIEQPIVRDLSLWGFRVCCGDLRLDEARKTHFTSLQDCFTRELKPGARPIAQTPGVLVSPCDGHVVACGRIRGTEVLQVKGSSYTLLDLLGDPALVATHRDGVFVTLRLTPAMYHRFHAPDHCDVDQVTYVPGETWNVNPAALKRIERLYCQNERAIVPLRLRTSPEAVTLVPVAAILVASLQFTFLDAALTSRYRGPSLIPCRASFRRGDELGHFRHGSTIVVLGTPGLGLADRVHEGVVIRMGEPLMLHVQRAQPGER